MTTVLITDGGDPYAVTPRRCRCYTRLLARVRWFGLARALANGADPDSSALLSLQARTLHSTADRRRLARAYRRLVAEALKPRHPLESRLPLARDEILDSQELIEELAELLEDSEPAEAGGLARAKVLMHDGEGPLYTPELFGSLRRAVQDAIEHLAMPPTIHATT